MCETVAGSRRCQERIEPKRTGLFALVEHAERYRFAAPRAVGKRVLDVACGVGFGSRYLKAKGAREVVGVELDDSVVRYARDNYETEGIRFQQGTICDLQHGDDSFDVVVSFETIEHVSRSDAGQAMRELARVLVPGGIVIMSTPNRRFFEDAGRLNPFHLNELRTEEFHKLVSGKFAIEAALYQHSRQRLATLSPRYVLARVVASFDARTCRQSRIGKALGLYPSRFDIEAMEARMPSYFLGSRVVSAPPDQPRTRAGFEIVVARKRE